jgi:hypothetical protein
MGKILFVVFGIVILVGMILVRKAVKKDDDNG